MALTTIALSTGVYACKEPPKLVQTPPGVTVAAKSLTPYTFDAGPTFQSLDQLLTYLAANPDADDARLGRWLVARTGLDLLVTAQMWDTIGEVDPARALIQELAKHLGTKAESPAIATRLLVTLEGIDGEDEIAREAVGARKIFDAFIETDAAKHAELIREVGASKLSVASAADLLMLAKVAVFVDAVAPKRPSRETDRFIFALHEAKTPQTEEDKTATGEKTDSNGEDESAAADVDPGDPVLHPSVHALTLAELYPYPCPSWFVAFPSYFDGDHQVRAIKKPPKKCEAGLGLRSEAEEKYLSPANYVLVRGASHIVAVQHRAAQRQDPLTDKHRRWIEGLGIRLEEMDLYTHPPTGEWDASRPLLRETLPCTPTGHVRLRLSLDAKTIRLEIPPRIQVGRSRVFLPESLMRHAFPGKAVVQWVRPKPWEPGEALRLLSEAIETAHQSRNKLENKERREGRRNESAERKWRQYAQLMVETGTTAKQVGVAARALYDQGLHPVEFVARAPETSALTGLVIDVSPFISLDAVTVRVSTTGWSIHRKTKRLARGKFKIRATDFDGGAPKNAVDFAAIEAALNRVSGPIESVYVEIASSHDFADHLRLWNMVDAVLRAKPEEPSNGADEDKSRSGETSDAKRPTNPRIHAQDWEHPRVVWVLDDRH